MIVGAALGVVRGADGCDRHGVHRAEAASDHERLSSENGRTDVESAAHFLIADDLAGARIERPQIPRSVAEIDDAVVVDGAAFDRCARFPLP